MKAIAKSILKSFHLLGPARRLRQHIKRQPTSSDRAVRERYFTQSNVPKLHIGCGDHLLASWLNTDYEPVLPDVMRLDATQPFPFKDETFSYIYSEHVIEHISYWNGAKMLSECFRVSENQAR